MLNNPNNDNDQSSADKMYWVGATCFSVVIIYSLVATHITEIDLWPSSYQFWIILSVSPLFIWTIFALWTIPLIVWNWKVNYTRKGTHITTHVLVFLAFLLGLDEQMESSEMVAETLWTMYYIYMSHLVFVHYIRDRVVLFRFIFSSVNRPEDEPYSNLWMSAQTTIMIGINAAITSYCKSIDKPLLALVPVLITGFSDGLAEPIGIRWGTTQYQTRACCTSQTYTRSFVGSFWVWLSSLVFVSISIMEYDSVWKRVFAVVIIPSFETMIEAFSPHTLDGPFLQIIYFSMMYAIYHSKV